MSKTPSKLHIIGYAVAIIIMLVMATFGTSPYSPPPDKGLESWLKQNDIKLRYSSGPPMGCKITTDKDFFKQIILENNVTKVYLGTNVGNHYWVEFRNPKWFTRYSYHLMTDRYYEIETKFGPNGNLMVGLLMFILTIFLFCGAAFVIPRLLHESPDIHRKENQGIFRKEQK